MAHTLRIEPLGQSLEVPEDQTVLEACLRAGLWLPHACCHGLCATCKVRVSDGEVDHGEASPFALMDFEREEGLALACCARLQSDATIEAEIEDDPDAEGIPVRDVDAVCSLSEAVTPTIRRIRLQLEQPLPFQAGQYVNLEVPDPAGGAPLRRAFSIANPPHEVTATREIELHVRRVPGGAATGWLHGQLRPGMGLRLAGPYGRFFVRGSAHGPAASGGVPLLFIAGGSGLASPRAMVLELLQRGCPQPITLVVGQRTREELYDDDLLRDLATRHPHFRYLPVLSHEPEGSGWDGARGWAHEAAVALHDGDFRGRKAYLCGPPAMVEAAIGALMQGRLFERDIHTEQFLSAADAQRVRSPVFRRV
ncbi:MAG: hypothetical protein RL223_3656 [Pseudomonadota bacterium]|jgi:phenol hydroxylase P5 protein